MAQRAPPSRHLPGTPGTAGLRNPHSTCYQNAVVQCLAHVPCITSLRDVVPLAAGVEDVEAAAARDIMAKLWGVLERTSQGTVYDGPGCLHDFRTAVRGSLHRLCLRIAVIHA